MNKIFRLVLILVLLGSFAAVQVFRPESRSTTAVAELIVEVSGELSADGKAHVLPPAMADVSSTVRLMRTILEMEQSRDSKTRKFLDLTPEEIHAASNLLVVKADQTSFFLQVRDPSA